jgi:diaminohydroxyphosphoribosylaminopyrimidine deaminase/5-amino-6-(5-phosphoribosylamino)uracil reductase
VRVPSQVCSSRDTHDWDEARLWDDEPVTDQAASAGSAASDAELVALDRAIAIAAWGDGAVLPNPVVGCVLLDEGGSVITEGYHAEAGGPHAEIAALTAAGQRAAGSTAVVTLEPCNHTGRTGPCSTALIDAGVGRVVYAVPDPWPTAAGGGGRLRDAGVEVVDLSSNTDPSAAQRVSAAMDGNRVWLTTVALGRPFVTFKAAISIDGRVAARDGTSRWITSEESRRDAHRLRNRVDTIMVGVGTALADDPQLAARDDAGQPTGRQPLRVVVDTLGRTPSTARILDDSAPSLVATAGEFGVAPDGRVDLVSLLTTLYARGRRHVMLEGGPRLAAAFFDLGLVDEVLVYLAPMVLGAGRSAVESPTMTTLTEAVRLELRESTALGPDLRLRYAVLGGR